jgi:tetratricopeptide (TPR) repeat protein
MRKMRESARVDSRGKDSDLERKTMFTDLSHRNHRSSRAEKRRRRLWRTIVLVVSVLLIVAAFAGGFFWRSGKEARGAREEHHGPTDAAARLEARRLLDEGVRARHEERWQGAMNALAEARRTDPEIGGIDVVIGEIALEQKDAKALRLAARQALQRGQNEPAAKLLLALEAWMQRGDSDAVTAGNSAKQHLVEAVESQPSSAAAFFFHGELNRLLGESGEAKRSLQAALYRQTPWHSAAVLGTKLQLAARESSEIGWTVWAPLADGQSEAVLELREAINRQSPVEPALAQVLGAMSSLQVLIILDEAAVSAGLTREEFAALRRELRHLSTQANADSITIEAR